MSKLQLARRWLAGAVLTGALAACSGEATVPTGPSEQAGIATHAVTNVAPTLRVRVPTDPTPIGIQPLCGNPYSERICPLLP